MQVSARELENNPNGNFYAYVPYTPNSPATTYGFQTPKTGTVNLQFDVTPLSDAIDGYIAFNTANCYVDFLNLTKIGIALRPNGQFAANNNKTMTEPTEKIPYSKDKTYTVALSINIASKTFRATVDGKELAKDFAFRSNATIVENIGLMAVASDLGSFNVTNISEKLIGLVDNNTIGMDESDNPAKFKNANAYFVGPSRKYKKVQDVIALLKAGDTVYVAGDATYPAPLYFDKTLAGTTNNPITIKGISVNGKRPVIKTLSATIEIDFVASNYVFDNIEVAGNLDEVLTRYPGVIYTNLMSQKSALQKEITNQTVQRGILQECDNLVIRNCIIHDAAQGILSHDIGSGNLTVEYCEVFHNGVRNGHHNLYLSTDESLHPDSIAKVQFNYIHDCNSGNGLKSRASRNDVYYNWFENNYNQSLELIGPDPAFNDEDTFETAEIQRAVNPAYGEFYVREDSEIIGNVIIHSRGDLVRVGGDGTSDTSLNDGEWMPVLGSDGLPIKLGPAYGQSFGRYRFVNNTFVDYNESFTNEPARAIRIEFGVESVEMYNNVFYKPFGSPMDVVAEHIDKDLINTAKWASGERQIKGANNWVQTNATNVPDKTEWTGTIAGIDPGFTNSSSAEKNFGLTENSPLKGAGISLNKTVATWPDWTNNTLNDFSAGTPVPDFSFSTYFGTPVQLKNTDNEFPNPMMKVEYMPLNPKTMTVSKRPIMNVIDIGAFSSTVSFKRAK